MFLFTTSGAKGGRLLGRALALVGGWSLLGAPAHAQHFAPAATYAVGATAQTIALADVNRDDWPDLLTANAGSNSVSVLLNQAPAAPGTFPTTAAAYPSGGTYPVGLAVGDLNGDGWPDLVLGHQFSQQVSVLLNRASAAPGTFAPAQLYATGHATRGVALGDVNGDGRLDVVATSSGTTVGVLLNQAARPGTLGPVVDYACGGSLNESLVVGDVDEDGRVDIIVANNAEGTVSILRNSATAPGTFPTVTTATTGGLVPRSLALGDVDGDGHLDLVVANAYSSTIGVLHNAASQPGRFPASAQVFAQPGAGAVGIAVADLTGDGRGDIVTANYLDATGTQVGVLPNAPTQAFANPLTYPSGSTAPHSVVVGDLDGDGRLDVALAHLSGRVGVLLNRTATTLASVPTPTATGLTLYPNPARGHCVVAGLAPGTPVQVLDGLGREVARGVADAAGKWVVALPPDVAAGSYLVRAGAQLRRLAWE